MPTPRQSPFAADLPTVLRELCDGRPIVQRRFLTALADAIEQEGIGEATAKAIINNLSPVLRAIDPDDGFEAKNAELYRRLS